MSESDDNIFLLNHYRNVQKDHTVINARGPATKNITLDNINLSLRNGSRWQPANFQPSYAKSVYGNPYSRRETSPMSVRSNRYWPEYGEHSKFTNYPSYQQRDRVRGMSPMSLRSVDTNISALDIVDMVNNYNEDEIRMVMKACKRREMRLREKRFIERRNRQQFQRSKVTIRPRGSSGSDSLNSDDNIETRSTYSNFSKLAYKENVPSSSRICNNSMVAPKDPMRFNPSNFNINRTDRQILSNAKEVFHFGNQVSLSQDVFRKPFPPRRDKMNNGHVLPSEQFKKPSSIANNRPQIDMQIKFAHKNGINQESCIQNDRREKSLAVLSEEDNVKETVRTDNNNVNSKNGSKKRKSTSKSNAGRTKKMKVASTDNEHESTDMNGNKPSTDFTFAIPQLPSKRVVKNQTVERSHPQNKVGKEPTIEEQKQTLNGLNPSSNVDDSQNLTVNDTMRRRKLFTQTLDITNTPKNISSDGSSPTKSAGNRRTRKLTKSTSCLTREVQSNTKLMELLQRELPSESFNRSSIRKDSKPNNKKRNKKADWDVYQLVSSCNDDAKSETFSEEEIFTGRSLESKIVETNSGDVKSSRKKKSPHNTDRGLNSNNAKDKIMEVKQCSPKISNGKKSKYALVDAFWATDIESEIDEGTFLKHKDLKATDTSKPNNVANKENIPEMCIVDLEKEERHTGTSNKNMPIQSSFVDIAKNNKLCKNLQKSNQICNNVANMKLKNSNTKKITLTNSSTEEITPKGHYQSGQGTKKHEKPNQELKPGLKVTRCRSRGKSESNIKTVSDNNKSKDLAATLKENTPMTRYRSRLQKLHTVNTPALCDTPKNPESKNKTAMSNVAYLANRPSRIKSSKTLLESLKMFDTPTLDSVGGKRTSERIRNRLERSVCNDCSQCNKSASGKCTRKSPRIKLNQNTSV